MDLLSVRQAAEVLGVRPERIHQRIRAGSLPARRVGRQWAVDSHDLLTLDPQGPGRPLSSTSAWSVIALSAGREDHLGALTSTVRRRMETHLSHLQATTEQEDDVVARILRTRLGSRAERQELVAAPVDLPDLMADPRLVAAGVSHPMSNLCAADMAEGYVMERDVKALRTDHLLVPPAGGGHSNVVLHVVSDRSQMDLAQDSPDLLVAVDLAEHRGPREEARAAAILRDALA